MTETLRERDDREYEAWKHFVAIAAALADERPRRDAWPDGEDGMRAYRTVTFQWKHDVRAIGRTLQQFSDEFDYARFLDLIYVTASEAYRVESDK